ncbi:sigma 54-interacting transcriptional regulator [Clostridium sp. D2Q-11]|uniref:Sigma 54-interacting transcriptional regulator n=1 Tax=Anaeromonas frigoriresistens TaxID=2683708 RepID=A0A942UPS1_9FIRM|nr:sigma 54-interacting transcriptional regulator [Anaeromonas frigoriresistens]
MLHLRKIKAIELMDTDINGLSIKSTIKDAIIYILNHNLDNIPIVDEKNKLIGILPKRTIIDNISELYMSEVSIEDMVICDCNKVCIEEDDDANIIKNIITGEVFVVNKKKKLRGILTRSKYLTEQLNFLILSINSIIESTDHAVVAIDKEENIIICNTVAEKILGINARQALGKKIEDVIPLSKLPNILRSGKTDINNLMNIGDKKLITNRAPIIQNEEIKGAISLFLDVTKHNNLLKELEEQKNVSQVLNTILETVYDGIVVVDKEGYITMISKTYERFLGVENQEVIGKHVTDVIQNTRMHVVADSGLAEIADIQKIRGSYMIASRIPIIKEGEVVGAVGKMLFRNVDELNDLYKKINLMERELKQYKGELTKLNKSKYTFENIIGKSKKITHTIKLAKKASQTDSNVLILGESGTGKELLAHAIHNDSTRNFGPFVKVNCAAIPSELLESELFGYEDGAFTGAKKGGKIGKFELADGGTIFLDEIGDMPLTMQSKLLRVIQEKEIERVGGTESKRTNVRIIAATNKNLEEMIVKGEYRQDLYYRLNVFTINVPPLHQRPEDISTLSHYFLNKLSDKYLKDVKEISDRCINHLISYTWPGNIRELENVIERAINLIEVGEVMDVDHLPQRVLGKEYIRSTRKLDDIVSKAEKEAIIESIRASDGNKTKAAKLLGIGRTTFYEKLNKYKLNDI